MILHLRITLQDSKTNPQAYPVVPKPHHTAKKCIYCIL